MLIFVLRTLGNAGRNALAFRKRHIHKMDYPLNELYTSGLSKNYTQGVFLYDIFDLHVVPCYKGFLRGGLETKDLKLLNDDAILVVIGRVFHSSQVEGK